MIDKKKGVLGIVGAAGVIKILHTVLSVGSLAGIFIDTQDSNSNYHFEQIVEQVLESEESYLEQEEVTYEGITVKTPLNWKKLGEGESKIRLERKEGIKGYVIVDKIIASKIESYEALINALKEEMNLEEDQYRIKGNSVEEKTLDCGKVICFEKQFIITENHINQINDENEWVKVSSGGIWDDIGKTATKLCIWSYREQAVVKIEATLYEEDWEVGYRIIQEELEQLASSLEWG